MEPSVLIGFALLLAGAACGGSFGLPSKFVKAETPWETLWGPFFGFVTILIPLTVFPLLADGLFAACQAAGWAVVILPIVFGILWGLGSMTLGLSFAFIGLSLAYAINYGAQIMVGGMGPFVIHHPEQILTGHGYVIMAGVLVCIVGVVVCGRAGILKTRSQEGESAAPSARTTATSSTIVKGLGLAFASGILCACYSIAYSFGGDAIEVSKTQFGNEGWRSTVIATALILWGGSISACGYCACKLTAQKTWGTLVRPGIARVLGIALVMALLHDGAILLFGIGAPMLGDLGEAVGYPAFMSFAIIVGNINGFLTGEWKGASSRSMLWITVGILVLIIGVTVLARGQDMQSSYKPPDPAAVVSETTGI